jgi:hypothetical protein
MGGRLRLDGGIGRSAEHGLPYKIGRLSISKERANAAESN